MAEQGVSKINVSLTVGSFNLTLDLKSGISQTDPLMRTAEFTGQSTAGLFDEHTLTGDVHIELGILQRLMEIFDENMVGQAVVTYRLPYDNNLTITRSYSKALLKARPTYTLTDMGGSCMATLQFGFNGNREETIEAE